MIRGIQKWRIAAVILFIAAGTGALAVRLFFLHLGGDGRLRQRVELLRRAEIELLPSRGRILDRTGNVLAVNVAMKNVCADPYVIARSGHSRFVAYHLARALGLDPRSLVVRLQRPGRRFAYVKRRIPLEQADTIARMRLHGVFMEDTTARYYPLGELMCHVLGFVNMEEKGCAGVELTYDRFLRGSGGLVVTQLDGRRRELYHRRLVEMPPFEGMDVYLTLDMRAQYIVEEALRKALERYRARGAWAIVQRVKTGEIVALASLPSFDLNRYRTASEEAMLNRAIGYIYEPGSTFKVAVLAAALNEGVVTPEDVVDCEGGAWWYRGKVLHDHQAYDRLTVADVLKKSSNIGAAKVALRLGEERLARYLRGFNVGRRLGIDLPGEQAGILREPDQWSAISATRIAIGHEVGVTSLQMLNILCCIANKGLMLRPHVVSMVADTDGSVIYRAVPTVIGHPIDRDTAQVMLALLRRVTEAGGTGVKAAISGCPVAGKTGTAQKPICGGYSRSDYIASFVGVLPADDPDLGIIVVVDTPQPLHAGGRVAAPVFAEIAQELLGVLDLGAGRGYL